MDGCNSARSWKEPPCSRMWDRRNSKWRQTGLSRLAFFPPESAITLPNIRSVSHCRPLLWRSSPRLLTHRAPQSGGHQFRVTLLPAENILWYALVLNVFSIMLMFMDGAENVHILRAWYWKYTLLVLLPVTSDCLQVDWIWEIKGYRDFCVSTSAVEAGRRTVLCLMLSKAQLHFFACCQNHADVGLDVWG